MMLNQHPGGPHSSRVLPPQLSPVLLDPGPLLFCKLFPVYLEGGGVGARARALWFLADLLEDTRSPWCAACWACQPRPYLHQTPGTELSGLRHAQSTSEADFGRALDSRGAV